DQAQLNATLEGILKYVDSNKSKTAVYLDDISTFSTDSPMLGAKVAQDLYNALSKGKIQIFSASAAADFEHQIAGDSKMKSRFERISIRDKKDEDSFVGDKISPDLREIIA